MTSPTLSRCERGQDAIVDVWPDRELHEANRHMHDFLAVLGHELRSPLAAIRNALQVLAQLGNDNAVRREQVRALMERQTQRIGRLVDDLLDVSHIEHGQIQLNVQRLDLAQSVTRAVETIRHSIEERGHRLEVALPQEPVYVDADPNRLEQVLTNLLNNATKYMEPGGRIWLTTEVRGDEVVLRVRDAGIGIDPAMLPHIFDPFWQVKCKSNHSPGGLGLGLALVRKLVELHGGRVSASSPGLGCGSEFAVCFPTHAEMVENFE